jgi:hypothetical protein
LLDYHQLAKLDGIWHEVKAEKFLQRLSSLTVFIYREISISELKEDTNFKIFNGKYYVPHPITVWNRWDNNVIGPRQDSL